MNAKLKTVTAKMIVTALLTAGVVLSCGGERKNESRAGETEAAQAETAAAEETSAIAEVPRVVMPGQQYVGNYGDVYGSHLHITKITADTIWFDFGIYRLTHMEAVATIDAEANEIKFIDTLYGVHFGILRFDGDSVSVIFDKSEELGSAIAGTVHTVSIRDVIDYANTAEPDEFFDDPRDNQAYRVVRIGNRTWFAQNLNYRTNNSLCYDNDHSNCEKYGKLYRFDEALEACPEEWRVPTREDWVDLLTTVVADGSIFADRKLKSQTGWVNSAGRPVGNGTDDFGFTAMPGGSYQSTDGRFVGIGRDGSWWIAVEEGTCFLSLSHRSQEFLGANASGQCNSLRNGGANSVRCVRD